MGQPQRDTAYILLEHDEHTKKSFQYFSTSKDHYHTYILCARQTAKSARFALRVM